MKSHYCSFRPPPVPGIEIRLPGWWEVGRQSRLKIATVTPGGHEREVHYNTSGLKQYHRLEAFWVERTSFLKHPCITHELVLNVCVRDILNRR